MAQLYHPHPRQVVREVLGFEVPALSVLHVPDAEVLQLPVEEGRVRGLSAVEVGYGDPWPPAQPATMRSGASGDATVLDVRGRHVGVQHSRAGRTRLAWQQRHGAVECDIAVHLPYPPVQAVELLVRCDVLAGGD